jgi:hypothetical protein
MFVRSSVSWRGAALSDTAHMILDSIVPVFFVMAVGYLAAGRAISTITTWPN